MRVVVVRPSLLPPPPPNSWPMSCLAQPPVWGLSGGPSAPSDPMVLWIAIDTQRVHTWEWIKDDAQEGVTESGSAHAIASVPLIQFEAYPESCCRYDGKQMKLELAG
ncbi:hypothetical protein VZT92_016577 [Zoarces viviparus]|uniref:Uncharacterized protein n=1 Tax=Zoarces viviparus TaxID=48416 RepID=A0AAW1ET26_ZOAVI